MKKLIEKPDKQSGIWGICYSECGLWVGLYIASDEDPASLEPVGPWKLVEEFHISHLPDLKGI